MFLLAILLLGVGIQAAPTKYSPKCSYQPKEECTTIFVSTFSLSFKTNNLTLAKSLNLSLSQENVERKVTDVECHIEYKTECHTEYKKECHIDYKTECHKVPTTRQVKQTEVKCTKDYYGKKTCEDHDIIVTVRDTEEKCEEKPHEKCDEVPHQVCEDEPHEVCDNVVTKKTEKVPRKHCKTVQKKVCH